MDVFSLVALIYDSGGTVIQMCKLVKQCPAEAARIAFRVQNVLGVLQSVAGEIAGVLTLEQSLLDLRALLEKIRDLIQRCKRPARLAHRVRRVFRIFAMRDALVEAESELERVTADLKLPLLADIKRQLNRIEQHVADRGQHGGGSGGERERAANEALIKIVRKAIDQGMKARSSRESPTVEDFINDERAKAVWARASPVMNGTPASYAAEQKQEEEEEEDDEEEENDEEEREKKPQGRESAGRRMTAGELIVHLRRVRFEDLKEGDVLGVGTFGIVKSGVYMGKEVAVKKARAPVEDASQRLDAFR